MERNSTEMSKDDIQSALTEAKRREKLKEEQNQLFVMIWIGLGALMSVLWSDVVLGGITGLIAGAVYAYGIHGRRNHE
ncbi:MAG TPA: hypothetical protein DF774_02325 [Rheinheimera sp.]|uniref:hypothetical protein n=1 Tax=Rheinheimera sp. TaxID=1869214 RepID=UPI000ED79DA4|nr:hypothetical protein [Rheinheimera sp.]HCU64577.1 hypothetical protein [Rheinheimera sp.]